MGDECVSRTEGQQAHYKSAWPLCMHVQEAPLWTKMQSRSTVRGQLHPHTAWPREPAVSHGTLHGPFGEDDDGCTTR